MYSKLLEIEKMPLNLFWISNVLIFKNNNELRKMEYDSLMISSLQVFSNEIFIEFSKNNSVILTSKNSICVFNVDDSTKEIIEIDEDCNIQIKDYDGRSLLTRIKDTDK
ncbi:MAG: hypothetical protein MUF58_05630 [Arcicella sp.]|jgi:hypothetical protein|nr:hypothetical protein [Arcicella sp.]